MHIDLLVVDTSKIFKKDSLCDSKGKQVENFDMLFVSPPACHDTNHRSTTYISPANMLTPSKSWKNATFKLKRDNNLVASDYFLHR